MKISEETQLIIMQLARPITFFVLSATVIIGLLLAGEFRVE